MPISGGDTVAKNITAFGGGFLKHVGNVMKTVTENLDTEVTKNMSLTDHTQADLALLDHPYAKRHGPEGKKLHEPYWQVHKQTGNLLRSKSHGVTGPSIVAGNLKVSGHVKLDETRVEYAQALIWGTSVMIPRDFLSGSVNDKAFQERTRTYLQTNLRDMVFNFKGVETR